jgi:hypothetical protein
MWTMSALFRMQIVNILVYTLKRNAYIMHFKPTFLDMAALIILSTLALGKAKDITDKLVYCACQFQDYSSAG